MTTCVRARLFGLASISVSLLLLNGCAGVSTTDSSATAFNDHRADRMSGSFPVPHQIEDNVNFWRNVYGNWSRGQVAFYDEEHLGIVYDVVDLPEAFVGGYNSADQRDFVNSREAQIGARLASLEAKEATGAGLTSEEQALREKIVSVAGPQAIAGAHQRLKAQRGVRERFRSGLEISGRYDKAFREIFRAQGVPEDLAYLPHVESSFQVNARSTVGAAGIWQFMPATGRIYDMHVGKTVDQRLDPIIAAEGAGRYVRDAYDRLESWPLAITSYNHGVGGMQRARSEFGDDFGRIVQEYKGPAFGFASRNFYAQFLAAREVAGNPDKYFPEGVAFEPPLSTERVVLNNSLPIHAVANHYGVDTDTLSDLNLAWLNPVRNGRAHIPASTTVWVPRGTLARVASQPQSEPILIAKAEPPAKARIASAKPAEPILIAKAEPPAKARIASTKPAKTVSVAQADRVATKTNKVASNATPAKAKSKLHVVKPNETLYRVAATYDMSVDELRRLNRLNPKENTIRPGQRLLVSI